jgi:tetratricopeptide (TPR) repeat protein
MTTLKSSPLLSLVRESEAEKLKGNHKKAIEIAEQVLVKSPDFVPALEEIADNYLALEELRSAKKAAHFILELTKDSYTAYYILGFISAREKKFEEGSLYLETANTLYPNHPEILRNLGWCYFMNGQEMKGVIILERALNLQPENTGTLCDLGICYLNQGNKEKALDLFYKALSLNPHDERIQECVSLAESIGKK